MAERARTTTVGSISTLVTYDTATRVLAAEDTVTTRKETFVPDVAVTEYIAFFETGLGRRLTQREFWTAYSTYKSALKDRRLAVAVPPRLAPVP